jgi:hypothetical protein
MIDRLQIAALITKYLPPVILAIATWFSVNFVGKPILAIREKRREALQIAERYAFVRPWSSDDLQRPALKSLYDVGTSLRAYSREASVATRAYCRLMGYDLDMAARCLRIGRGRTWGIRL